MLIVMDDKKILGVRRNVFFLGLVSFFNDFSSEMVRSIMPVFLTAVLGAPAVFVGFIDGMADALASVWNVFAGWFSDKVQKRKPLAILGYTISVSVRYFFSIVGNFWQFFWLRMLDRAGKGFRDAPRDALIAESVEKFELGKSFGFHRMMDNLGATVGPLFAFLVLPIIGLNYRKLILIAFFIGILAIFSFVFVKDKRKSAEELSGAVPSRQKLNWQLIRNNKKFAKTMVAIFIFGLGALPVGLVLLKVAEIGFPAALPLAYFIYGLAFAAVSFPLGRLGDRVGERAVIATGFAMAAVAYFGLARFSSPLAVMLFFVILGVYGGATDGLLRALAAKNLAADILATGQGFLNMAVGFSSLFAGIIGGLLWTGIGSGTAFVYAGILSIIGLLLFLRMTAKTRQGSQTANYA